MSLRVFISSPGDVIPERRRAQLVIEKLAKIYARHFSIEPILWEVEPMLASGHFQDQIIPPGEADIVVLIVWSRLGTPLPAKTATREYRGIDGRVPVTGTEWEFEDALAAQKRRGAPDLLAYRKQVAPLVSLKDKAAKASAEAQWEKLDAFWARWFINRGEFRAAFTDFETLDVFEQKLESDLRKLIERRIATLRDSEQPARVAVWSEGSPFRGLQSYGFEHAPIFFGRSLMTTTAVEQLATNAEGGRAFLLILGASGAGKSSLAQAGVLHSLTGHGIVPGVGLWRRAVMRPAGHPDGPFASLAEALGKAAALPELLSGQQDVAALARHLKASADDPTFAIVAALDGIEAAARERGELLVIETARLALVIDQLEELFTASDTAAADRAAFVRCLDSLARSGRVYVIGTMRSDYWHRAAETPLLVEMAAGAGRLDLLPPTTEEIIEMIRRPAEAAGLTFETDPAREIALDAILAAEAGDEPGALPLLSFLLDELYLRDVGDARRSMMTFASMRELGGLRGAIANRAEAAFLTLPDDAQQAFARVLRALVAVSRSGAAPTSRVALMSSFAPGSPPYAVVATLLEKRLLVADGDGASARIRLAHESLMTHWQRARDQIVDNRRDLETRDLVEQQQARWAAAPTRQRKSLLLRNPDLANAVALDQQLGDELDPRARTFIAASQRAALANLRRVAAVAIMFALLAAASLGFGIMASRSAKQAQTNLAAAQTTQSRFLADQATQRSKDDDQAAALALALEALPDTRGDIVRPYTPEAELAAFGAWRTLHEIAILDGHADTVASAAFSADGRRIATASDDKTARIWDADTGRQVMVLTGHEDKVRSATFSADGRYVLTTSDDATARIWDAASGRQVAVIEVKDQTLNGAAFSPDGRRVVAAFSDKTARIWDVDSGKQIAVLVGHEDEVNSAAFSPDGRHIVTASTDKTARIWDADTRRQIAVLVGHEDEVASAVFSANGRRILTRSSRDYSVRIWDEGGKQITVLEAGDLRSAAFSADGGRIVTAHDDGTTHIWETDTGKEIRVLGEPGASVVDAAFSPDDRWIVTASKNRTARLWNAETGDQVAVLAGHADELLDAAFSPDGRHIVTASFDKTARVWDVDTSPRVAPLLRGHTQTIVAGAFSPDGRRVATASLDKTARIWDADTGRQITVLVGHEDAVENVVFSPDGQRVLTASSDKTARIWEADTGRQIAVLAGHTDRVNNATFSADGRRILTTSFDHTARIWDADTGKQIAVLRVPAPARKATLSPDARRLLTVSGDDHARIWDATNGQQIAVLVGHEEVIQGAAFSDDGRRAVTLAVDGMARIWDAETGKPIAVLRLDKLEVRSAALSADGRRVATVWSDNAARIWDADTGRQIAGVFQEQDTDLLRSADFMAEARRIVTLGDDDTTPGSTTSIVRIWEADTGKQIAVLTEKPERVFTIAALSPDSRRILTVLDETARVWRVFPATQDLVEAAQKIVPRCLTRDQRAKAFLDPAPPAWCIEMEKWPYQSQDWKDWLRYERANADPPLPDTPAWKPWIASHRTE